MNKQAIIFDLDGTLAVSKSPLDTTMADVLNKLLQKKKVAVVSGGGFPQFQVEFILPLESSVEHVSEHFKNLFIMPTSGSQLWVWDDEWKEIYENDLKPNEKEKIISALQEVAHACGFDILHIYGPQIEDRKSQITFSALGQEAPVAEKESWDPHQEKRLAMRDKLLGLIPEFEVRLGGMTTIDITKKGFDKAYGVRELSKYLHIPISQMLYVGDALYEGGNDAIVEQTDIETKQVRGPEETHAFIESMLASVDNV